MPLRLRHRGIDPIRAARPAQAEHEEDGLAQEPDGGQVAGRDARARRRLRGPLRERGCLPTQGPHLSPARRELPGHRDVVQPEQSRGAGGEHGGAAAADDAAQGARHALAAGHAHRPAPA
eukprot:4977187-Prymnesium_polylepis.2